MHGLSGSTGGGKQSQPTVAVTFFGGGGFLQVFYGHDAAQLKMYFEKSGNFREEWGRGELGNDCQRLEKVCCASQLIDLSMDVRVRACVLIL